MNPMKEIRIEKVTLNIGAGKDQNLLKKGVKLLKSITGIEPVQTVTQKRIPTWGLRPGLPVGCKITLRGKKAEELIPRLLDARDFTLEHNHFDPHGTISFGIPEYIDIKGAQYDPDIGIIGLQACVTLERRGFRVKRRRLQTSRIGKSHTITKEEAQQFMNKKFNVRIGEVES